MKLPRLPFDYHPQEQRGVFFLLLAIFLLQCAYWGWLNFRQPGPDSVRTLPFEAVADTASRVPMPRFNPNFISDYKGYLLGMSPGEIDKLHQFRASGQWIRSPQQFREVTGIGDSLYHALKGQFRFPAFTARETPARPAKAVATYRKKDLNKATREDLIAVRGVGPVLAARILRFREALGGYLLDDQLHDVYALDSVVVERIRERFTVRDKPMIEPVSLNQADRDALAAVAYIDFRVADSIIAFRERNGAFTDLRQLADVPGFPNDRIGRIGLYLKL